MVARTALPAGTLHTLLYSWDNLLTEKHLLSTYSLPGLGVSTGDTVVNMKESFIQSFTHQVSDCLSVVLELSRTL